MTSNWIINRITLFSLFLFIFELDKIIALRMSSITVPDVADVRETIELSCSYHMGTHKLNSVKWYKDGREFFRYSPMTYPSIMKFPVVGVNLQLSTLDRNYNCNHEICTIVLERLSIKSGGAYRCEISGDAPEFKLISETANMTIGALPKMNPSITGVMHNYIDGDEVFANCTSDLSYPGANLMWYINNERAPVEYLAPQRETTIEKNGFQYRYRSLEMHFHADKSRFEYFGGLIKLKCVAQIEQIPAAMRETTVNIYISSMDNLSNQRLVNWLNSVANNCSFQTKWILFIIAFIFLLHFDLT